MSEKHIDKSVNWLTFIIFTNPHQNDIEAQQQLKLEKLIRLTQKILTNDKSNKTARIKTKT